MRVAMLRTAGVLAAVLLSGCLVESVDAPTACPMVPADTIGRGCPLNLKVTGSF